MHVALDRCTDAQKSEREYETVEPLRWLRPVTWLLFEVLSVSAGMAYRCDFYTTSTPVVVNVLKKDLHKPLCHERIKHADGQLSARKRVCCHYDNCTWTLRRAKQTFSIKDVRLTKKYKQTNKQTNKQTKKEHYEPMFSK